MQYNRGHAIISLLSRDTEGEAVSTKDVWIHANDMRALSEKRILDDWQNADTSHPETKSD